MNVKPSSPDVGTGSQVASKASNHTPGPWQVGINSNTEPHQTEVLGRSGNLSIASGFGNGREADANARLIAAAPELLQALEALSWLVQAQENYRRAGCSSHTTWNVDDQTRRTQALASARAVIAKAKGI